MDTVAATVDPLGLWVSQWIHLRTRQTKSTEIWKSQDCITNICHINMSLIYVIYIYVTIIFMWRETTSLFFFHILHCSVCLVTDPDFCFLLPSISIHFHPLSVTFLIFPRKTMQTYAKSTSLGLGPTWTNMDRHISGPSTGEDQKTSGFRCHVGPRLSPWMHPSGTNQDGFRDVYVQ